MHPRNQYNSPHNFNELAAEFPELRPFCLFKLNNKVVFNFQSNEGVRTLTTVLLKKDFGLKVDIPTGNLVPRVPSRLDYLLLIEDLLRMNNITDGIKGIDIGTGASCIYALLGAKKFNWKFVATDYNEDSTIVARQNVATNALDYLITIAKSNQNHIFEKFCYNAPDILINSGIKDRKPPQSTTIARKNELETEGGEVEFVSQMIRESENSRIKVKFYTSLLGKKKTINALKRQLEVMKNIRYTFWTLQQGKTARWVVIWTFSNVWIEQTFMSAPVKVNNSERALYKLENFLKSLEVEVEHVSDANKIIGKAKLCKWVKRGSKHRNEIESPPIKKARTEVDYVLEFRAGFDVSTSSFRLYFLQGSRLLMNPLKQYILTHFPSDDNSIK